ncbi:MAG: hypothetical protein HYT71_01680 [Candidatus Aenigmarchaeota archaeon]|nr:hypothetical protein [Candidatus Aenigmarchaeota archaeon]
MERNLRFYLTCLAFFFTVPAIILAIGFVDSISSRVVTIAVIALFIILVKKFPLEMTGDLYELETDLSMTKKAVVLSSILLGAVIGIILSLWLGFF